MARTADWRIDLMKAHPRLFKMMTGEPERSFAYPELVEPGFDNIHNLHRGAGESGMYYARYDRKTDTMTEVPLNTLGLEK